MDIAIPTGTFDILPEDPKEIWRSSHLWSYVEKIMRDHAASYGLEEIRTPIFERTELFCRSVGDSSDIVKKEMYTFEDKGGRMISLRPEGTASVVRSFVEKQLHTKSPSHRFFYIGPMFRYERPQSGRFRQHHQFGTEVFGLGNPEIDAEQIAMCYSLYEKLGLKKLTVYINSLGDPVARAKFRTAFTTFLAPQLDKLSADSQSRFHTNPLRIFDSKDEGDKEIIKKAPTILDFLSPECQAHFNDVQKYLTHLGIPFQVNSFLVRGLDYYTRTVFEVVVGELGAQNSIAGGGRYDGLVKELGGPDIPSIGFATGIERVIQTLLGQNVPLPERPRPHLYLIPLGDEATLFAFSLAKELRSHNISCLQDTNRKKLKQAMQQASSSRALFTIVLGEDELQKGVCNIKEMDTGKEKSIPLNEIPLFFELK